MQIDLVKSDFLGETNHYTFQLSFDNRAFSLASLAMTREEKHLPISASVLFDIFPFCIIFGYVILKVIKAELLFESKSCLDLTTTLLKKPRLTNIQYI